MAFGKKEKLGIQQDVDEMEIISLDEVQMATSSPREGGGFMLLAGSAVTFAFLASLAVFWMLDGNSHEAEAKLTGGEHLFSKDSPPVARDYNTERPARAFGLGLGQMSLTYTVNTTETGFDAIDSELHERCLRPISKLVAATAESDGKIYLSANTGAAFLGCSMQIYTRRFCEPQYRRRIVRRLEKYSVMQKMAVNFSKTGIGRLYADVAKKIDKAAPSKKRRKSISMRNPAIVPVQLRNAIRELSERGILTKAQFSPLTGPPDALLPFFVEPKHDACGKKEKSWKEIIFG